MKINSRTEITLYGYVGTDTTPREILRPNEKPANLTTFRMFVRPKELVTEWYSVTAWRSLALAVGQEIRKGMAIKVIGHQRLIKLPAKDDLPERIVTNVTAHSIGIFTSPEDVRWLRAKGGDTEAIPDPRD